MAVSSDDSSKKLKKEKKKTKMGTKGKHDDTAVIAPSHKRKAEPQVAAPSGKKSRPVDVPPPMFGKVFDPASVEINRELKQRYHNDPSSLTPSELERAQALLLRDERRKARYAAAKPAKQTETKVSKPKKKEQNAKEKIVEGKSAGQNVQKRKCNLCHKPGHAVRDCPKKQ